MSATKDINEEKTSNIKLTKEDLEAVMKPLKDNGINLELEDLIFQLGTTTIGNIGQALALSKHLRKDRQLFIEIRDIVAKTGLADCKDSASMVNSLCGDESLCQKVCKYFLKGLGMETGGNMGASPDPNEVADALFSMKEEVMGKLDKLEKNVGDTAFKKQLSNINYAYLAGSLLALALSWSYMYETIGAIQDANQFITNKRNELKQLYKDEIEPILVFMNKIKKVRMIYPSKYKEYQQQIKSALKSLNHMKEDVVKEKKKIKTKGFNNTLSAVAMVTSAVTSFGMAGPQWLKVLGGVQATTAVAHTGMAVGCLKTFEKLNEFNREIQTEIDKLRQAQKKLNEYYENYKKEKNKQQEADDDEKVDVNDPNHWGTEQVVEWTKKQNKNYGTIAQIFDDNGVEGADLLEMDDEQLQWMGITNSFQRKQLLRKLEKLK